MKEASKKQGSFPILEEAKIIQAFEVLLAPNAPKQIIKKADEYISECERSPEFALTLMKMFHELQNAQTKWQILIHLKNVLKRNWTAKRRQKEPFEMSLSTKQQIKQRLVQLYKVYWKSYYKEFNQIFRYLGRHDFPANYAALNQIIKDILDSIANHSIQQILGFEQLLPYLSLVKVIYKQYTNRKCFHSLQNYNKYLAEPIMLEISILQKLNSVLKLMDSNSQDINVAMANKLLQCSRKIDKIIIYSLQSMTSALQYNQTIVQIVRSQLQKMNFLLQMKIPNLKDQLQLNILAICQGIEKIQAHFPLLFYPFLTQYLQLNINLLFNEHLSNDKLVYAIVQSNITPLKSFPYYMTPSEFQQSLESKPQNQVPQSICHQKFKSVYNSTNIQMLLEKIVQYLMRKYNRQHPEDEIMFEDDEAAHEGSQQKSTFQAIVILIKSIMQKFKPEAKEFVSKVMRYLEQHINEHTTDVENMLQIVLLTPKVFNPQQIEMKQILILMTQCYSSKSYQLFCRLVRIFSYNMEKDDLLSCFNVLTQILLVPNIGHRTIYQSSVCIHKLLVDYPQVQFSIVNLGPCLYKIFIILQIYKSNPNHLWNLLSLLNDLLKTLDQQVVWQNLSSIVRNINVLAQAKQNKQMVLVALCELLQNVLILLPFDSTFNNQSKNQLYCSCLKTIMHRNSAQEQPEEHETELARYQLLLCTLKNMNVHHTNPLIIQNLRLVFNQLKSKIIEDDPYLFFQILEQYVISGIISVSALDLIKLYTQQVQPNSASDDPRIFISFFSLYFSSFLITNQLIPDLLYASIQKIGEVHLYISHTVNGLRMLLMLIICHHILVCGPHKIFDIFNSKYQNYTSWFGPFVCSLQLVHNKYSGKVITLAILSSFKIIQNILDKQIQGNLPIDGIIKFITLYTDPVKPEQAVHGYLYFLCQFNTLQQLESKLKPPSKWASKRVILQVNAQWCQLDLTQIYRREVSQLFKLWDWGVDDLHERYSDNLINKIAHLLDSPHK